MSDPLNPASCCKTPAVVDIPGIQGDPGEDGSDGIDAFTTTTADFTIPAAAANVTILVVTSKPFAIGQQLFLGDGTNFGNFQVVSFPSTQSIVLKFLNNTGDSATGLTISSGAQVVPTGIQGVAGTNGFVVTASIDAAVGGSQALNTTPNTQVLSKSLTLSASAGKNYILYGRCRFDYVGATFAANQVITFKIRRTNNTAGDVPNAVGNLQTQIITTKSFTAGEIGIFAIPYTTQGVSDVIQPMASVDATPGAGAVNAVECSISAIEIT